eukprot:1329627-Ditylum_brightwellii.AAC.1
MGTNNHWKAIYGLIKSNLTDQWKRKAISRGGEFSSRLCPALLAKRNQMFLVLHKGTIDVYDAWVPSTQR